MKLLIVYGTTEGHTRAISEFLKNEAKNRGHQVTVQGSNNTPVSPDGFDMVLIGASVHKEAYQSSIVEYAKRECGLLNAMPSAFVSVSLSAGSANERSWRGLEQITSRFLEETGWVPDRVEQVAGALMYSKYGVFKRFVMRLIVRREGGDTDTSTDYVYTDWEKLRLFLDRMLKAGA